MPRNRIVAVLFTDVVGSTELLSRVGPSAADGLRDRHFAEMRSALAVHRGIEVKTLGDGMMAAFDSATESSGLQNMGDRIGALGGELRISSEPGAGTMVRGSVPVDET